MKTSSAKAKGRRCGQEVVDLLYAYAPDLKPGDISVTSSGVTGRDVQLSPAAREIYPLAIECKNQESLNIWSALEQADGHKLGPAWEVPVVFFRRNHSKLYVAMDAELFLKLVR